ncbi:Fur family transcriptional regulator [Demequina aestuarii]|uniref:Fur family transcriptional regulator n=1 Tax=Demequina aestuarii TaxID=327095 RepID=UPI0007864E40|nr:Fur family transcriptional regulator [Demequina aestuarii]
MTAQRMTRQRAAVLELLDTHTEFRSAQAWHDTLRHDGSSVGLATVYRTLQSLAEAGDLDTVVTDSGETLYRRCEAGEQHHHHLRCRVCGRAEDIDVPEFESWADRIARSHGYSLIDHTVELTGVCTECHASGADAH